MVWAPLFGRLVWELLTTTKSVLGFLLGMFPTSILGCFAFVGSLLIYNFRTRTVLRLTVDRAGIQYGKGRLLWPDIGAVRFGSGHWCCSPLLHLRGMLAA